eukprot:scaffold7232_cov63-Cyclotella_meneghiniana.AAC.7
MIDNDGENNEKLLTFEGLADGELEGLAVGFADGECEGFDEGLILGGLNRQIRKKVKLTMVGLADGDDEGLKLGSLD